MVVLALTPDLLATDVTPNRLLAVQRKLQDLLKARQDGETAIVVYAGSAHTLVPLTDDLPTMDNLLKALRPSIMPVPASAPTWVSPRPWSCSVRRPVPAPGYCSSPATWTTASGWASSASCRVGCASWRSSARVRPRAPRWPPRPATT